MLDLSNIETYEEKQQVIGVEMFSKLVLQYIQEKKPVPEMDEPFEATNEFIRWINSKTQEPS
jgi:hypothetical protein